MAFVLVQHLDPTHQSVLSGLLSRATTLPVREAQNRMPLQPDHVYVIPPNTKMTLADGVLKLVKETREKGVHHSIDYFLESLAHERGPQAIGVILSGSASDCTALSELGTSRCDSSRRCSGLMFAHPLGARFGVSLRRLLH